MKLLRILAILGIWTFCVASPVKAQGPSVATQGDHFAVNGQGRFLLFISYFDAMRRAGSSHDISGVPNGDVDTDFGYLRQLGYDGIRIFPTGGSMDVHRAVLPVTVSSQ